MENENMKFWKSMARPPLSALKTIKGGRLSGMSNISPQWRWQIMTEQFGAVGFGWKYTVEKRWTSPGENGEHFAFAEILLYYKVGDEWSAPVPGEGGSMLVAKESKGFHNNDEAFKMAVTDALGTAMAKIGVGADIYLGTFDGSKYNEPKEFPKQISTPKDAVKHVQKPVMKSAPQTGEEVPPTEDSLSVDEQFPKDGMATEATKLAGGEKLSADNLRKSPNIKAIKEGLVNENIAAEIPVIINAINDLGNGHSIEDVVAKIVADTKKEEA